MIEWQDEGILLGSKLLGESKSILSILTRFHGRIGGVLRLTRALRVQGGIQAGNTIKLSFKARLEEHLGSLSLEVTNSLTSHVVTHHPKLLALTTAMCLIQEMTAERHPYPLLYEEVSSFLNQLKEKNWMPHYLRLEEKILQEMGFGLKLKECCVTGTTEDLIYVSPKTGRAVSRMAGDPYKEKLLRLPSFLLSPGREMEDLPPPSEMCHGFRLMDSFLKRHMGRAAYEKVSQGRDALLAIIEKHDQI